MLRRLAPGIALASMAALVLVGCTPEEPTETTSPPATGETDTPDEATLDRARESWERYQERMSALGEDPDSATVESITDVAAPAFAEFLHQNFQDAADRRVHTEGERRTVAFEVTDATDEAIAALVCVDLSGERLIGDEGIDLTPADRQTLQSSYVELTATTSTEGYVVAGVSEFNGPREEDPCE